MKHLISLIMAQIANVFIKVVFKVEFDLNKLVLLLESATYNPNGLVFRLKTPKAVFLIFRTGIVIGTGIKSEKDMKEAVRLLYKLLKSTDLFTDLIFPQVQITNYTATFDLKEHVNCKFRKVLFNVSKTLCAGEGAFSCPEN